MLRTLVHEEAERGEPKGHIVPPPKVQHHLKWHTGRGDATFACTCYASMTVWGALTSISCRGCVLQGPRRARAHLACCYCDVVRCVLTFSHLLMARS